MISIIIPIYNAEKTLMRCVDSVISQSFTDWELILVNNGSFDASADICNNYSIFDNRIKVLNCEKGVSLARNVGIEASLGDYLFFIDSDDTIEPNALSILSNIDADIVKCNYNRVDNYGNINKSTTSLSGSYLREEIIHVIIPKFIAPKLEKICSPTPMCSIWGTLIRKSIVQNIRFNPSIQIMEDKVFLLEMLQNCNSITFEDRPLYNYYQNSNSVLSNYNDSYYNNIISVSNYIKNLTIVLPHTLSNWKSFCIQNIWNIAYNEILSKNDIKTSILSLCKYRRYLSECRIKLDLSTMVKLCNSNITWLLLILKCDRIFLYLWKKRLKLI